MQTSLRSLRSGRPAYHAASTLTRMMVGSPAIERFGWFLVINRTPFAIERSSQLSLSSAARAIARAAERESERDPHARLASRYSAAC